MINFQACAGAHDEDSHAVDVAARLAADTDCAELIQRDAEQNNAAIHAAGLTVDHVGDSRLYRCRGDASTSSRATIRCRSNRSMARHRR